MHLVGCKYRLLTAKTTAKDIVLILIRNFQAASVEKNVATHPVGTPAPGTPYAMRCLQPTSRDVEMQYNAWWNACSVCRNVCAL